MLFFHFHDSLLFHLLLLLLLQIFFSYFLLFFFIQNSLNIHLLIKFGFIQNFLNFLFILFLSIFFLWKLPFFLFVRHSFLLFSLLLFLLILFKSHSNDFFTFLLSRTDLFLVLLTNMFRYFSFLLVSFLKIPLPNSIFLFHFKLLLF